MQDHRSLAVLIPRAKIKPPSRPSSRANVASGASLGADCQQDLAATERKLMSYLDQTPYTAGVKSFVQQFCSQYSCSKSTNNFTKHCISLDS